MKLNTHTHIYIYIYIYICVCARGPFLTLELSRRWASWPSEKGGTTTTTPSSDPAGMG